MFSKLKILKPRSNKWSLEKMKWIKASIQGDKQEITFMSSAINSKAPSILRVVRIELAAT